MSKTLKTLVAAAALAVAGAASATPIVGKTSVSLGQVIVSFGVVNWVPDPAADAYQTAGKTYGAFGTKATGATGVFADPAFGSFSSPTFGWVQDMQQTPGPNNVPIGVNPTPIPNFLHFYAKPNWLFSETYLAPGQFGSPFVFTDTGGNTSVTMSVNGMACDDTNANGTCDVGEDQTKWTGIFSSQYTGTSTAALVAKILGGGTLDQNDWSATIEATRLPEPATVGLVGLALAGLGFASRRRQAK
ncbi:PEP-CTERM sorting domain-containing protein [Roseateles sp. NT4]|uniref:PEP-CTERM sorting domain-containing protein n=1 Tax=Roseateles sp. NT4 TaxID=3453715 RepID=UPI003EEE35B9